MIKVKGPMTQQQSWLQQKTLQNLDILTENVNGIII